MTLSPPGKLIVISGPSGAGKTSLLRHLLANCPAPLISSISATTRPPRPGERDGFDYHFLTRDEFSRRREADEFVECCEVYAQGDWYGTLKSEVTPSLAKGKWVILEIDVEGTIAVLALFPDAVTIFVTPGSPAELERRLRERGTESEAALQRRLAVARREFSEAHRYQHQVINDQFERAANEICAILTDRP